MTEQDKPGFFGRLFGRGSGERKSDDSKVDLGKVDPGKVDPGKVDPGKIDPGKIDSGEADDAKQAGPLPGAIPDAELPTSPVTAGTPEPANDRANRPTDPEPPSFAGIVDAVEEPEAAPAIRESWWRRLSTGLSRSSGALSSGIGDLFTKRKLDAATIDDLEDILIQADLGLETAARITAAVGSGRYGRELAAEDVRAILATEVEATLAPVARPLIVDRAKTPFVILMIGVNGSGKTTTIGKLAAKFRAQGRSVMLAAGDTFRAAAIEQLKVWAERTGSRFVSRPQGSDAAGLAYDALNEARAEETDIVLIDTAGRLQNKVALMDELEKVLRVIRKIDASAPHATLLVLDATVGQNALSQVEIFGRVAGVTGLVMTKLDGTARGGILVAIAAKHGLPVHFIGVGEGIDDLEPFSARDFARAIAGLEEQA